MDGAQPDLGHGLWHGLTIDRLLDLRASDSADTTFLRFSAGDLTFGEARRRSMGLAHGLADLGVQRGQLVPVLMANGPDFAITWLALCTLGAVSTLLNTEFRGPALVHALNLSGAETVVVDARFVPISPRFSPDLVCLRPCGGCRSHGRCRQTAARRGGARSQPRCAPDDAAVIPSLHTFADPAMVLFTSGTTGPSKGCVLSHRYAVRQAELMIENLRLRRDDVLYCPFPMFHIDATVLTVVPAMLLATTAAIGDRFSASGFWDEIRAAGATVFDFMGATLDHAAQAAAVARRRRQSRSAGLGRARARSSPPSSRSASACSLVELYGSTDAGVPIYHPVDEPRRQGSCGRPIAQYDVRLFDELGGEVGIGEVGEIVVRPNEPSLMSDGYYGMPATSLESRRNLWFHTGDLARRDADGYFYFVGRRTDSIRRRGENISAFEVEEVVKLHPSVLDAAAFGVPSELTEDDVMVAVVVRPGHTFDAPELITFCTGRMARHMVPRYVDVVETLAADADREGREVAAPRTRCHGDDVGP